MELQFNSVSQLASLDQGLDIPSVGLTRRADEILTLRDPFLLLLSLAVLPNTDPPTCFGPRHASAEWLRPAHAQGFLNVMGFCKIFHFCRIAPVGWGHFPAISTH